MSTAGAVAAAAIAEANRAAGTIVELEADEFQKVLYRMKEGVVVVSPPRRFQKGYRLLTSYRGLAFVSSMERMPQLPSGCEVVTAKKIWVPG